MILLHDAKKKSMFQYHNQMNLIAALLTFKCVITVTVVIPLPIQDLPPPLPSTSQGYQLPGELVPSSVANSSYRHLDLNFSSSTEPPRKTGRHNPVTEDDDFELIG
jgi:hypothetical protein